MLASFFLRTAVASSSMPTERPLEINWNLPSSIALSRDSFKPDSIAAFSTFSISPTNLIFNGSRDKDFKHPSRIAPGA